MATMCVPRSSFHIIQDKIDFLNHRAK